MRIHLLPRILAILCAMAQVSFGRGAPQPGDSTGAEHLFGLRADQALGKGPYTFLAPIFDMDAFCNRITGTLPVSEEVKRNIQKALKNPVAARMLLKNAVSYMGDSSLRFIGVRSCRNDTVLLYRNADPRGNCRYTGFVVRQVNGSVKVFDILEFCAGELLSETMRRAYLLEAARDGLLAGELTAGEKAVVSAPEAWMFFVKRCEYGKFDLIKEAYEKLPPALQDERAALALYASSGWKTVDQLLVPLDRWRRQYPGDPCPDIHEVQFLWRLYEGPRSVQSSNGSWMEIHKSWQPDEEARAVKAIERANSWLDDPAQLLRLARYYLAAKPANTSALFREVIRRYPNEEGAYFDLLALDLKARRFEAVAETLRLEETAFQTNLTAMVNAAPSYADFRKTFAWKKWQHDCHGMDAKNLIAPAK